MTTVVARQESSFSYPAGGGYGRRDADDADEE
jgi:hypothetical protein